MPLLAFIFLPALAAGVAYLVRSVRLRMGLLVGTAVVHLALVGRLWTVPARGDSGGWLAADPLGLLVLSLVSILFLVIALYAVGFLGHEPPRGGRVFVSGLYFGHPEASYFAVDLITRDQVENYAIRKVMPLATVERWLAPNLAYEVE